MAQDPETTKAKVKKRSAPSPHPGGEALHRWHQDTPKNTPTTNLPRLTRKPQPNGQLPRLTRKPQPNTRIMPRLTPRPESQMLTKHPHKPVQRTDYSHSGGRALNAARNTPEHKQHNELVKLARFVINVHAKTPLPQVTGDTKGDLERLTADAYKSGNSYINALSDAQEARSEYTQEMAKQAKQAENDKYSGSAPKLALGFIHMKGPVADAINSASMAAARAATVDPNKLAPGLKQIAQEANKIVPNAAKEAVDLPANVVPSLYYAGQPLAAGALSGDSTKLGQGGVETLKRLAQPYVNLAEHPGKTLTEHPLSSTLMGLGVLKGADRVAGRVEQRAVPMRKPSKPYAPISQKLPGTAAENLVLPRQGALAYRLQKRKAGNVARMSDSEIAHRTDETFYHSVHQSRQEAYDAIREAKDSGIHDEAQLQQIGKDKLEQSRARLRDETVKDMALRDKSGRLRTFHFIEGKGGAAQAIEKWGQALINQGREATMTTYKHGGEKGRTYRGARGKGVQTLVPRQIKTGDHKSKYVLMPKIAADQLEQHDSYLAQTPLSAVGQAVGGTFRRTVLPFSPKWLNNNYTEAAIRGGLNGVGGLSFKEAKNVFGDMGEMGQAEWNSLVKSAGHGGMQRQLLQEGTTFADRLEHTKYENLGKSITRFGQHPGPKTVAKVFDKYTDVVFSQLNGKMENAMHMGMAGKVLRRNPLMSQKIVDLTRKAMTDPDGPKTVQARNNLISLGREVDRMFGKYGKFSPSLRRSIATWTPFIPWSLNAVHFITQHLPNDHPVVTSLIASAHQASQEWRNRHGLGYFVDGHNPPFLQGAIPGSNGSHWMIFSQGTPFGAFGDPTGTAARGFNPLGTTILNNLAGMDWKGDKFKNPNPIYNTEQAIISLVEATTPIGYATSRIEGTGNDKSAGTNLKNWANPYHPIKGKEQKSKKAKKTPGLFGGGATESPSMFGGSGSSGPSMFGP